MVKTGYSCFLSSGLFDALDGWFDAKDGDKNKLISMYENGELDDLRKATTQIYKKYLGMSHVVLYGVSKGGNGVNSDYDLPISTYYSDVEKANRHTDYYRRNNIPYNVFTNIVPVEDILLSYKFMVNFGNTDTYFRNLSDLFFGAATDFVLVVNKY